jgi:hypothetical protein
MIKSSYVELYAALRVAHVVGSSSKIAVGASIPFTSIRMKRLFPHIGSNTQLLTASQASEVIELQHPIADLVG